MALITATAAGALLFGRALRAAAPATQPAGPLLAPLVNTPAAWGGSTVAPTPYRPYLPPPVVSHEPRLLKRDGSHEMKIRSEADVPPLAAAPLDPPAEPRLPAAPPIHLDSARDDALDASRIAAFPDSAAATVSTDPTRLLAPPSALTVHPPARTIPPHPQFLNIPDPSREPGAIPTPMPAAEEPPTPSLDHPPTTLPVTGK